MNPHIDSYKECNKCADPVFLTWILRRCRGVCKYVTIDILNRIGHCYMISARFNKTFYYPSCVPKWAGRDNLQKSPIDRVAAIRNKIKSYLRLRSRTIDRISIFHAAPWDVANYIVLTTLVANRLREMYARMDLDHNIHEAYKLIELVPPAFRYGGYCNDEFAVCEALDIRANEFSLTTDKLIILYDSRWDDRSEIIYFASEIYLDRIRNHLNSCYYPKFDDYAKYLRESRVDQSFLWYHDMAGKCDL